MLGDGAIMLCSTTAHRLRHQLNALTQGLEASARAARTIHAILGSTWNSQSALTGRQPATPDGARDGTPPPTRSPSPLPLPPVPKQPQQPQQYAKPCTIYLKEPNVTGWSAFAAVYGDEAAIQGPFGKAPIAASAKNKETPGALEHLLHSLRFASPWPLGARADHWVPVRRAFKAFTAHLMSQAGQSGSASTSLTPPVSIEQFVSEIIYFVKDEHNGPQSPFEVLSLSSSSCPQLPSGGYRAVYIRACQDLIRKPKLAGDGTVLAWNRWTR
jgi:hypothetical protein